MHSFVRVGRQFVGDVTAIQNGIDAVAAEVHAYRIGDRSSRLRRTHTLTDDDALPLIEHLIRPHPGEEEVLRQRQEQVHDREGE